jgi:hypothetical protein
VTPGCPAGKREAATHSDVSTLKVCVDSEDRDSQDLREPASSAKAQFDKSKIITAAKALHNPVLLIFTGDPPW